MTNENEYENSQEQLSTLGGVNPYRINPDGHSDIYPGVGGITYNVRIGDPACGLFADHVEPGVSISNFTQYQGQSAPNKALNLFASDVFPCDYPDSDVILMAHYSGLRIREIPVRMQQRAGGKSMHDGFTPAYYGIKMLLSMLLVCLNHRQWREWRTKTTRPHRET